MISSFNSFITTFSTQDDKCNFAEKEQVIYDKIIFSAETRFQEKLIRTNKLILAKAISTCQAFDHMHIQKEEMNAQIDKVKINDTRKHRGEVTRMTEKVPTRNSLVIAISVAVVMKIERKMLPLELSLSNCNGRNHFTTKCKKKNVEETRNNETDTSDEYVFSEEWLNAESSQKSRMTVLLSINDQKVGFQEDMGADVNILCKKYVIHQ